MRIQQFYRACHGKYSSALTLREQLMVKRKRIAAVSKIQRLVRGYWGRKRVQKIRIRMALEYCAAREIQRIYRGRRVMGWRDMRMNIIASFVLDRQYIERQDRVKAARLRYQAYLVDVNRDSASDSYDEDAGAANPWTYVYDQIMGVDKWINIETNEVVFEEPADPDAMVKALVGVRVKVLWLAQGEWFEGHITKYHFRKKRHRIDYDDGDYEWLDVMKESDRIQVLETDGVWTMISLYKPYEVLREIEKSDFKIQNALLKEQAYNDAKQWRIITDDRNTNVIMYISDVNGLIRTGAPKCRDWVIHDDGFGFPCFYNTVTGKKVYEDPRFNQDVSEDLEYQREYILQEMRYALYFCKDILAKYDNAVYAKDKKKTQQVLNAIYKSNKPKLLTAFLIRAKMLYKQVSVVDIPVDEDIVKELDYASWVASRMGEIADKASDLQRDYKASKQKVIETVLTMKSKYVTKMPPPAIQNTNDPPMAPRIETEDDGNENDNNVDMERLGYE
jgi:hypothetical protein